MRTLFLGYHNLKTEARSQEMVETLKLYGETSVVSYGAPFDSCGVKAYANAGDSKGIVGFMRACKKAIDEVKPEIIMLHDDYPLIFIPYIRRKLPDAIIIHDSSELYLVSERIHNNTWKKKLAHMLRYVELANTKKADIVIAANRERAELMKEYFKLKKIPLVYENIHKIQTSYDEKVCAEKYGMYFVDGVFTAIYGGGVAEERLTYKMTEQIGALGSKYQLLIVGAPEVGGEERLNQLIGEKRIKNVHYFGLVAREELKYLMEKSDVSISAFALDVVNNINCASGKVYEGLFLGKPLLAGVNPSLKSLCTEFGVGISTEDFGDGCVKLRKNYDVYKANVRKYTDSIDYDYRTEKLKQMLDKEIAVLRE